MSDRSIGFTAPTIQDAMKYYTAAWMVCAPVSDRPVAQRIEALPEVRSLRREWTAQWLRDWLDEPPPFEPNAKTVA